MNLELSALISLHNITVSKAGTPLLVDFNWDIRSDEHWVIFGENGSGKTTLLETIAGFLTPVAGEITYDFVVAGDWDKRYAERKRNILYIPAHAAANFLGNHEVFYQQRYYSLGDERVPLVKDILGSLRRLEALDLPQSFFVGHLLELPVTRLSNGQMKKVLIVQKMMDHIPKLLLMDYPFEGLDFQSREDLIEFLDHIVREHNVQLILVEHHHHLPAAINRRLVMSDLKISSMETISINTIEPPNLESVEGKPGMTEPIVEMKDVTIRYGNTTILDNFNWTIARGEHWALTGRNGSGKTTLFSMIYADHPMAYSQKIFLFGKRRGSGESIWDIKRRINYLGPELLSYLKPADLSISGHDYLQQQHHHVDDRQLEATIAFFQAEILMRKAVRTLSSGQLQLLMVINSLLSGKELLLLDEPFQFLDLENRSRLNDFLHERLHPDTSMVLITHYEEDVRAWTQLHRHLK